MNDIRFAQETLSFANKHTHSHWNEICPSRPCPFSITPEEFDEQRREGESYNENADFWSSISDFVSRDGFVSNEDYNRAIDTFAELRKEGLRTLSGIEREEFELATR